MARTGNVDEFPSDQGERSFGRGVAYGGVSQCEEPEMQPANQKKPAEAEGVAPQEFPCARKASRKVSLCSTSEICMVAKRR